MPPGVSLSDFYYILPELVLTGGALLVLIADVLLPKDRRAALAWVTLLALGATAASLVPVAHTHVEVADDVAAAQRVGGQFAVVGGDGAEGQRRRWPTPACNSMTHSGARLRTAKGRYL